MWWLAAAGCAHTSTSSTATTVPAQLDDGWVTAAPADVGLATSWLSDLTRDIDSGAGPRPDSVLIARHGKLVYEAYWNGFDRDRLHDLRSATKSVTGLLIGIARDRGHIGDGDDSIAQYLPGYAARFEATPTKRAIAISHLMTMRSGLDCDDWDPESPGQEERMYLADDWVDFTLALAVVADPGEQIAYCTGGVVTLGAILAHAAGVPVPDFARRALFQPLGIAGAEWQSMPSGGTDTGGHLHLSSRDFAKLAQVVLDRGVWAGRRIVSAAWIDLVTRPVAPLGDSQYGHLFWVNAFRVRGKPVDVVFARGNGGQYAFIAPELGLVAVFTGSHYNSAATDMPIALVGKYILPAALGLAPAE